MARPLQLQRLIHPTGSSRRMVGLTLTDVSHASGLKREPQNRQARCRGGYSGSDYPLGVVVRSCLLNTDNNPSTSTVGILDIGGSPKNAIGVFPTSRGSDAGILFVIQLGNSGSQFLI
jgi:hypothetical protein